MSKEVAQRMLPWLVAVAFFMQSLDTTILNTAIPAIAAALQVAPLSMKAVMASYTLSLAVFIPISGWVVRSLRHTPRVRGGNRVFYARFVSVWRLEQYSFAGRVPHHSRFRRRDDGAGGATYDGAHIREIRTRSRDEFRGDSQS